MGRKSRHYRNESDPLLGIYSSQIAATSSVRFYGNPLHARTGHTPPPPPFPRKYDEPRQFDVETGHASIIQQQDSTDSSDFGESPIPTSQKQQVSPVRSDSRSIRSLNHKTKPGYRIHRVSYTAQNHVQVLFRMYGSAFPQVFPFCIANFCWTVIVMFLKDNAVIDLTFHSSIGHSFMGLLVSFLVVSRSKISYDRFMAYRRHLASTYRTCRELSQFATAYTFETQTGTAKEWRLEVCYRTILLLRVTMDALLWSSTERAKWEDEYFQYHEEDDMDEQDEQVSEHFFQFRALTHGRRSMIDENCRAPISFSHILRMTIMEHPKYLGYKMAVNEYRDLLNFVTEFGTAFHEFRVLVFTPYPFSLIQMTRLFLFFWVYTLPLVLLKEYRFWSSAVILTFVTFGFIGIEYVSMALDDPFGDDTNDVDEHGMALLVYEDIYMALYRTDGYEAASKLREKVLARYKHGRGLDCYRDDLKGYDFWERHLPVECDTSSGDKDHEE